MPVLAAVGTDALFGVSIDDPSDIYQTGHPNLVKTVSTNYGFKFLRHNSASGGPEYGMIQVQELGTITGPRDAPGAISVPVTMQRPSRAGASVPVLCGLLGKPVKTQMTLDVPTALTATLASPPAAGNVEDGTHLYVVTFTNAGGETSAGASATVTVSDKTTNGQVELTNIPVGPTGTTGRNIYRTTAGLTTPFKLLTNLANNTATTFTDNVADGSLTTTCPATNTATIGAYRYVWNPSVSLLSPRSITAQWYKGGSIAPELLYGLFVPQYALTAAAGALVNEQATFAGQHHGLAGVSTVVSGSSGYTGVILCRGVRQDADKALPIFIKISTGPSAGTIGIKVETKASSPTYPGSEQTLYYNTTSKFQTKGGTQVSDWYEVLDENGGKLGADAANRAPFEILFTGDMSTLALNDEFKIETTQLIPSAASGATYTQYAPTFVAGCRFTSAHTYLTINGSTVEVHNATANIAVPRVPYYAHGPEARFPLDMLRNGYITSQMQVARRYDARTYELLRWADTRVTGSIELRGPVIVSGGTTTYREQLLISYNQLAITNTDSNVANMNWIPETVTLAAEQPDNGTDEPFTVTLFTADDWDVN